MPKEPFTRDCEARLRRSIAELPRSHIQVVQGGRQLGKTTLALQAAEQSGLEYRYGAADLPSRQTPDWLTSEWEKARELVGRSSGRGALLVLDDIQKIPRWSDHVKHLWDEDTATLCPLHVMLLTPTPHMPAAGPGDSGLNRCQHTYLPHWSFPEMQEAFGFTVDQFVFFGGYPSAARLIANEEEWRDYVLTSIYDPMRECDSFILKQVRNPAALRRIMRIGSFLSAQIVSYSKLSANLQNKGNVATVAHCLDLLAESQLLGGLQKYSGSKVQTRRTSPKLQAFNNALMTAHSGLTFAEAQADSAYWGRIIESAVGAYLLNEATRMHCKVFYWREGHDEVDFVVTRGHKMLAIEVKSSKSPKRWRNYARFKRRFPQARCINVNCGRPYTDSCATEDRTQHSESDCGRDVAIGEFLSRPVTHWLRD